MALIPGTVGAAPVQYIGAYGVELKDRFESLDAVDLVTGRSVVLGAPICAFGYRDSVFKHSLAHRSVRSPSTTPRDMVASSRLCWNRSSPGPDAPSCSSAAFA
jgi:UDP-N-acetylenolpyruvoylglucosamine reductase